MNPLFVSTLVLACTFRGAPSGIWLRSALPEHHVSDQSKDSVKVAVGLIATMAALVRADWNRPPLAAMGRKFSSNL